MNVISVKELKKQGLLIVDKKQFLDLLIEVNIKSSVDKRVKWIDRKTAIKKYHVTKYWLQSAEKNIFSFLQVSSNGGKKKYKEQSIIDEQERQAAC